MGFPVVDVLSDENHYSEFVCKICLMLAEYAGRHSVLPQWVSVYPMRAYVSVVVQIPDAH